MGQWVAVTHGIGRSTTSCTRSTSATYHRGRSTGRSLRWHRSCELAGCGLQLLLTSGFDRMLEQAYADIGEEYDVVSFVSLGRDRGKFLHIAADGAAKLIDEPNREVTLTSEARTVIVRLNGGADELSGRERDTYVVSEDDYIDYLSQSKVSELLPVGLAARLRRSHLLFVGYDLDDWSPRCSSADSGERSPSTTSPGRLRSGRTAWLPSSGVSSGSTRSTSPSDESLEELHRRVASELGDGAVS